jgi:SWI/SNF-related matrix-associated actin-dependent regulator 1 of chromatin subfamily A
MAVVVKRKLPTEYSVSRIQDAIKHDVRYTLGALLKISELHNENKINMNITDQSLLLGYVKQYNRTGKLLKKQIDQSTIKLRKHALVIQKNGGLKPANIPCDTYNITLQKNNRIELDFDPKAMYGHITKVVKSLSQYRYNRYSNTWTLPFNAYNLEVLFSIGIRWRVDKEVYRQYKKEIRQKKIIEVHGLNMELRQYQKDALYFMAAKKGKALIGDEMGLGKTPVSIAYAVCTNAYPTIVICPANLKLNWEKEIRRWVKENVHIETLYGRTPYTVNTKSQFIIINYDIIYYWIDELRRINPQMVIIDEIQYIKTLETRKKKDKPGTVKTEKVPVKRTDGTIKVARKSPMIIGLSGTPVENRVIEFFNALNLIRKEYFPSIWKFAARYADLKPDPRGFGWDMTGRSNTRELYNVLTKLVMIRRKKSEVMKELPDISRVLVPIEMPVDIRKKYNDAEKEFVKYLQEKYPNKSIEELLKKDNVLSKIAALRQICVEGKTDHAINWIQDKIDTCEKLVVFTYHRKTAESIEKVFKDKCLKIVGGMTPKERDQSVTKFQQCKTCGVLHHYHAHDKEACNEFIPDDRYPLLVANIAAAAEGLNFTASSNIAMMEYVYNPAKLQQVEARVHRSGQTEGVFAWYLVASDTIEEKIMSNIDEKMKTIEETIDGVDSEGLMSSFLKDALV